MTELLSGFAALIWLITALLPWQPWRNREILSANPSSSVDLSDITVVIPARNEADIIEDTLQAVKQQGEHLQVILVDDASSDATAERAKSVGLKHLQIISSSTLPKGWTGKLWAQEQGIQKVTTRFILLLDADIHLNAGILNALKEKQLAEKLSFISLMARLSTNNFWEKLLMPAFIYFFKMLYPFALANKPNSKMAAAAGGCILIETAALHTIGGMKSIKDAVIDDCSLAKAIKQAGYPIWIGLTQDVISQRPYLGLSEIWDMVARTAYSQLFYSKILLLICTFLMSLLYILPIVGLFILSGGAWFCALFSLIAMSGLYLPTVSFYGLPRLWVLMMPVIAGLYLLMTWTSAIRYWCGERSRWKGRIYEKGE